MTADSHFRWASGLCYAQAAVFWCVAALSALLLIWDDHRIAAIVQPLLVVLSFAGFLAGLAIRWSQTEGNRKLRQSQIRDAFGVPLGAKPRDAYYNNPEAPSLRRLALTTLENTKFTAAVLAAMLFWKRIIGTGYLLLFVLLLSVRETSLGWVAIAAQTLFSGGLLLDWLAMERFRSRTNAAREQLLQHFATTGAGEVTQAGTAVFLAAFSEYECAKDEAALPLESGTFRRLNPQLSQDWEEEKVALGFSGMEQKEASEP